ncbi:MAG TPA: AAA family ATPase, partial [Candidatus Paenibacillus intestinavium]|nr:AAA family ATPase [Candidatus Paenibacillus intestinavium]
HFFLDNPNTKSLIIQLIKDLIPIAKKNEKHLIFVSSQVDLPQELTKDITFLQFDLPDANTLDSVLHDILSSVAINNLNISLKDMTPEKQKITINQAIEKLGVKEEERYRIVQAALGLTCAEAENAFALTWVEHKSFSSDEAVAFVQKIKTQFINSSGMLEYIPPKFDLDDIGGLDELKKWLVMYQKAFTKEAKAFGLAIPKGVICTGLPGTGKSTAANATSAAWRIPLLRFDIGQIFGSLLGETEKKLRTVLRTAEALAPCILQIEEIEKSLAGISGGSSNDGGTTSRVGATLLTWMQEKTKPVFVFATANDISKLDSALVRKGRFDEIFFIDLPTQDERKSIFTIHIRKRNRNPDRFNLEDLATHSVGYGGAEIESAVEAGLWAAFNDNKRELSTDDILHALANTKPISITKKESIEALRQWADGRARNASSSSSIVNIQEGNIEDSYNNLRKITG